MIKANLYFDVTFYVWNKLMMKKNWWKRINGRAHDVHMSDNQMIENCSSFTQFYRQKDGDKNPKCSILICAKMKLNIEWNEMSQKYNWIKWWRSVFCIFLITRMKISHIVFIKAWNWKFLKWCWRFEFHSFRLPNSYKHQKKLKWTENVL